MNKSLNVGDIVRIHWLSGVEISTIMCLGASGYLILDDDTRISDDGYIVLSSFQLNILSIDILTEIKDRV